MIVYIDILMYIIVYWVIMFSDVPNYIQLIKKNAKESSSQRWKGTKEEVITGPKVLRW